MPLKLGHGFVFLSNLGGGIHNANQMSKALLIRNHPMASQFISKLFEVFPDEVVGWDAARIVGEVAAPDHVLTKKHYAVIRVCPPA
jgi:hypothetical protein